MGATRYSVSTLIRFDSYSVRSLFSSSLFSSIPIRFDRCSVRSLFGSILLGFLRIFLWACPPMCGKACLSAGRL